MKLKTLFGLLVMLSCQEVVAQHTFSTTVVDHESNEPIQGATVYFTGLNIGDVTDDGGNTTVYNIPAGRHQIRVSFVGYESVLFERTFPLTENMQNQIIELHHAHEEMEEIIINSTRSSRTIEDIPTRVEFIAGEELTEKGNMKPGDIRMLLNESTGIQTQQTSATSYNSSIRIQGLDGKYTQLLRDGFPLYSGFSGGLSLMQITPLDLKQVEVIKGASSTLYGGGAIAGLVNLITKTPEEEPELSFMLNGTSARGLDASGFFAKKAGNVGTTVFASYNLGTPYDPADIGLTAIPKFNRFTLNPKLFLDIDEATRLNAGVNIVSESRLGGNLDFVDGKNVADPYFERNETDRISTQLQLDHQLGSSAHLSMKNSLNFYDRTVEIPDFSFAGKQTSSFTEANVRWDSEKTEWIGGVNLWTDRFSQGSDGDGSGEQDLGFSDATIGAFGQNTWRPKPDWTVETGFRLDYQTEYGIFALPRFSLLYRPSAALTVRLGGGLGYKTPTVFSEEAERLQFRNILPIDANQRKAERSFGSNIDFNYRLALSEALTLSSNVLLFYTQLQDPLVLTPVDNYYAFLQPEGTLDTKGAEVNMKWGYNDFKLFIGYTHARVLQHYDGMTSSFPLVAKHRLNNVLMYEKHGNFWIGLEAYFFSPQQLGDGEEGKSYWITGLMTEKKLGKHFSAFLNFENFLDTRQTAFDTIYTGNLNDPQFRDIYAPVDGFVINGGFKWTM